MKEIPVFPGRDLGQITLRAPPVRDNIQQQKKGLK